MLDEAVVCERSDLLGVAGVALREAYETSACALKRALVVVTQQTYIMDTQAIRQVQLGIVADSPRTTEGEQTHL